MGNKVRIGMIGLGARGKGLLETAYLEHPDAEFVVVCDKYEDRCQEAAKVIEKSGRNTPKMVTDYKEVLQMPDVDAVIICASNLQVLPVLHLQMMHRLHCCISLQD